MAARKKAEVDTVSRFTVEGKPYEIDMNAMTWGEIEELEVYFDKPFDEIDMESARGAMFLAYLAVRRKRPTYSLDDIRALEVDAVVAVEAERPTKEPAPAGSQGS